MKKLLIALLLLAASAQVSAETQEPTLWERATSWYNQNPQFVETAKQQARQLAIKAGLITPTAEDQLAQAAQESK